MNDQLDLLCGIEAIPIPTQAQKDRRNWENAFQNWSNRKALDDNATSSYGNCGFGVMCDYCEDNSYGRPCVRALNEWCKAKNKRIDYTDRDFEKVWRGEV